MVHRKQRYKTQWSKRHAPTGPKKNNIYIREGNIFQSIARYGDESDFIPKQPEQGIDELPGSQEKIDLLAQRVIDGEELFCSLDRVDFEELDRHNMRVTRGGW